MKLNEANLDSVKTEYSKATGEAKEYERVFKENKYSMSIGEHLSLPVEFEKYFSLSIPKGYHLEALQIFTPDIMARIIDLPFKSDIEFVDNQIIFVLEDVKNLFSNFSRFQWQIIGIKHLINLIKPKIEKASWSKVGDMPYIIDHKNYDLKSIFK